MKNCSELKGDSSGGRADVQSTETNVTCLGSSHVMQVIINHLAIPGCQVSHVSAGAVLGVKRCRQSIGCVAAILWTCAWSHQARILAGVQWKLVL